MKKMTEGTCRCRTKMTEVIKNENFPFRVYWCKMCGGLQIAEDKDDKVAMVFKLPEMIEDLPFDDDF